jgi:arylsulfatase A-like enzyme/sucrose-6-phosphate hydrolase SacC (GH32 family)
MKILERGRLTILASLLIAITAVGAPKPNIVVIFVDDMGYGDIGPFGAEPSTPQLDRMAAEGMKLTDFYVSSSACTPSRAALMTGCYADRIGMGKSVVFPTDKRGLNPSEITIAEILKDAGYASGCFGKWHLGDQPEFMPLAQGFDEYEGIPYSNDMWVKGNAKRNYPPLPWMKGNKPIAHIPDESSQAAITDAITDATVDFIKRNKDRPFFAYIPHPAVHAPHMVTPERLEAAKGDVMTALVTEIDNSTGRILQALRDLGIDRNTLVFFTNDNGGAGKTSPGPLRGAKFGPKYEGHMRVATLAWWPGKIPAGSVSSEIMTTTDLLPTIAKLAGKSAPKDRTIDGKDIGDILLGKPGAKSPHKTLFYEKDGVRQGRWKLVHYRKRPDWVTELYDLETDLGEQNNLADQHPDRVKAMKAALDAHVENLEANTRPAAFVDNPKPLLSEPGHLPTLAQYVGKPQTARKSKIVSRKSPDVLFIAIDDMNDWTTLFHKDNPIQTPNLQRLAARGAFFSKAYCVVPACNPSRTAILTGFAPTTSGVYGNGNPWKKLLPDVVTLPQYFGQQGYTTKGGGKIFHHGGTGADREDNPSFQDFFELRIHAHKPKTNYNGYVRGGKNLGGLPSAGWDWGVHDVEKQTDEYTVDYVADVMNSEPRNKPLFLAAGIFRPHLPFWAPPKTFARYPFDEVKLPPRPEDDLSDVPLLGVKMSRTESFIFDNTTKPPVNRPGSLRKMVQSYQASADYADEMVGRLLDQLDKTGRAEDTIIILWSDHGYHLGDKNACVKFTLWEKANHVPFIIVAPGVTKPGTVVDRPVSLLDIYPTLVDLAGLPSKNDLDGQSLVPLLKNPKAKWTRPAIMTQGRGNHAVRSDRWRYIRYNDGTEELYDHNNDPWEWKNLAGDSQYASVIAEHKRWVPQAKTTDPKPALAKNNQRPVRQPRKAPQRVDVTPAPYTPAKGDVLIADFEGKDYANWKTTGEAMGKAPSRADTHRNRVTGYLGKGFVNTYLRGDKSTGEMVSPKFRIERKHINFLIGGGKHLGQAGVQLRVADKTVRSATGNSLKDTKGREIMDWHSLDVAEFIGQEAVIKIVDQRPGGWGHTIVDHIFQSDHPMPAQLPDALKRGGDPTPQPPTPIKPSEYVSPKSAQFVPPSKPGITLKDEWSTFPLYDQVGYDQSLRPQFHFTSRTGWLNDPNGMVYYDGEWHMLFQHFAKGNASGAKSWGNAVSTDLMHWQQLPHAINPYAKIDGSDGVHAIWSGSAVVDELNALGKQTGDTKTLFALYSATHEKFFQGGAYSTDKGRTWTKINNGKPVIPHQEGFSKGQRDPRVFYCAPDRCYYTIMMIGGPDRKVRLWKSTNLLNWEHAFDIPNKAAECIDMFHVAVDGDPNNRKWVVSDAPGRYEVGEFNGSKWTGLGDEDKHGDRLRFEYGDAWYAAQAFNQTPDGRTVHVGWLRSKQPGYRPFLEAGMPFTQQLSVPVEITLRSTPDGLRMFRNPVKEIEQLYTKSRTRTNITAKQALEEFNDFKRELIDLTLRCDARDFTLMVRGLKIRYERDAKEFVFVNSARVAGEKAAWNRKGPYRDDGVRRIPAPPIDGKVTLRVLVDRASLELFVNDGQAAASFVVIPDPKNRDLFIKDDLSLKIDRLFVHELKSIWPSENK